MLKFNFDQTDAPSVCRREESDTGKTFYRTVRAPTEQLDETFDCLRHRVLYQFKYLNSSFGNNNYYNRSAVWNKILQNLV